LTPALIVALWACAPEDAPPAPPPEDTACEAEQASYADADGDGFGDPATFASSCRVGEGRVADNTDCDDAAAAVHPGATETCNGVDDDCSGAPDEAWDADGDGASTCMNDCDDADPLRAPQLAEICDRRDNDCDEAIDEGFDQDGDGVPTCRGDCDDTNPDINPTLPELCDGVESDCDPSTNETGDLDGDGVTWCDGDCDDLRAEVQPGALEICDGLDNDCDGAADNELDCYGCVEVPPYLFCPAYVPYDTAEAACASGGAHLIYMNSTTENTRASAEAAQWSGDGWWIGLTDRTTEGQFVWLDGTIPTQTWWWPGEPNDSGGEDCAGTNFGDVGRWNDWPCTTSLPFICERDP
jgi:hypothetical protein